MDKQYDNELRGVLFVNEKKNPDDPDCKLPNLTGHIEIKGVKYSLSGWTRGYEKDGEQKKLVSITATHKLLEVSEQKRVVDTIYYLSDQRLWQGYN